jgi:hypothetical protein
MDPVQRRQCILSAVAQRLTTARLPWGVHEHRARCDGPLAVITRPDCDGAPAGAKHVELGVQVTAEDGTESLLWDCAVGLADSEEQATTQAVEVWASRTMPVFWELFTQDGTFAAHYPADDPDGIPGWHVIAGGITGWGVEGASTILQQWVVDNPLLPKLSALTDTFDRPELNGVRIFFGGPPGKDAAEVRVNGHIDPASSRQLYEAPWPRLSRHAYVSTYVLGVHR